MKIKSNKKSSLRLNSDFDKFDQEVKFDLYLQFRRVKQITAALDKLCFGTESQDINWLQQNSEFINDLVEELLDGSLLVLDGVNLDKESFQLSLELMEQIKQALVRVQQITEEETGQVN